ncbi:hypothetical protein [Tenacibaculum jejuense]|uniref:Uncharacterized protein n=1 Tax=Tenacibaculum jejuense TaxID=584609 RepID=A0A238U929_9FLAO|nr:hypothetical protein [Tenacibaculum jejuense]SNR15691.1 protein of unknown function [Tenacibaculum jejuense]
MKRSQILILFLFPLFVFTQQNTALFKLTKNSFDIDTLLQKEFGKNKMEQLKKMSLTSPAILSINNVLRSDYKQKSAKLLGLCECYFIDGKLEVINAVGFKTAIVSSIKVNLSEKTFESNLNYRTDGIEMHKFNPSDEFIKNITVPLQTSELEFTTDSKFEHLGIVKGKLKGKTVLFYEQDSSQKGYSAVQNEIISIFECQFKDYNKLIKEMEQKQKLLEKQHKN